MKKFIGCLNIYEHEDFENGLKMQETGIFQEIGIGLVLFQFGNQKIEIHWLYEL